MEQQDDEKAGLLQSVRYLREAVKAEEAGHNDLSAYYILIARSYLECQLKLDDYLRTRSE